MQTYSVESLPVSAELSRAQIHLQGEDSLFWLKQLSWEHC